MRTSFMWTLVLGSLSATGQNLHDPYADHTGTTFPIAAIASPGLSSAYDGEYMVFPASIFWSEIMDAGTAGHLILKVKAVYCFNADGRLVANITDIHGTVFRLNTALLAGGTYFLRVETSTGARSLPLAVIH